MMDMHNTAALISCNARLEVFTVYCISSFAGVWKQGYQYCISACTYTTKTEGVYITLPWTGGENDSDNDNQERDILYSWTV